MGKEYKKGKIAASNLAEDPIQQLQLWMDEAVADGVEEPEAVALATATSNGVPSVRMVLIKSISEEGLLFYTHYRSRKGEAISGNPRVSLVFYWRECERQVVVDGKATPIERSRSEAYFHSRPRISQLGTWVSIQGEVLESREQFEARFDEAKARFDGKEVPLPDQWGGYCVVPERIEFWQGGVGRMHDRINYRRSGANWIKERLSP